MVVTNEAAGRQKAIQAQAYVLGSLGGADIRLFTAYDNTKGDREVVYRGELAQESSLGLLDLASKLGGFALPAGIPDLLLSDLDIELITTKAGVQSFAFTGTSRLALGKKFDLLGLTVEPPEGVVFTFELNRRTRLEGQTRQTEGLFALTLTLPKDSQLKLSSALAWTRDIPGIDLVRELQNDDEQPDQEASSELIGLVLRPDAAKVTGDTIQIKLVEKILGTNKAASYLVGFDATAWTLEFLFLGEAFPIGETTGPTTGSEPDQTKQFTFPFLKSSGKSDLKPPPRPARVLPSPQDGASMARAAQPEESAAANAPAESSGSRLSQAIRVKMPSFSDVGLGEYRGSTAIKVAFPATIQVGTLAFDTKLPLLFALGSFAIAVDHSKGIQILSPEPELKPIKDGKPEDRPFELFGLEWRFFGAKVEGDQEGGQYHHFTLVTKDFNYQIQQAEGARIEVAYTKASRDPIVFLVEDFVVSAKGISITATVSDRPARLNGIDTQYRFHGSQLRIVENQILDFTLSGSGPLPPKLVGDAMADIALQFRQENGSLKLVAGAAKIQGNKILDCKGTRFRFSVDAMGLQFVNDDRFHIFFTLTGSARFALQEGDDRKNGALSLLPNIQIDLVDCPLTGDASVIAKHVKFLVELPKPVSFPFLGAYEFELRAIGFLPQFVAFDNDVAMQISGQIKFAQGKGDAANDKPDLHSLYIGLPEPEGFFPRLHMDQLPLDLNMGEAFKLSGVVEFKDEEQIKGFEGEGVLEIQGMPPIAASFGFYRVRSSPEQAWVRAWFIYLEVRQISFRIPVVEFFIREVGLGFGYRYTLVGIRRADEARSLTQLLQELKLLSRTQGDLSRRDRWALDIEQPGQDPRWTIVLRAMIAQLSAATSPLTWNAEKEEALPCVYLFDAVIAFRSDLTFFMNVRAWLNTSYGMFVKERSQGKDLEPLFSGFVFLWPRQKRFLAHLASNPNGHLGSRPPLPDFVQSAIRSVQFSATLLLEPGLSHFELGWPNMLRWSNKIGPLDAEIRGGFIFRISTREMVLGISFLARASLEISTSIDLGLVGASVEARANAAFGARYIGLVEFATNRPTLYGAIGLELRIQLTVALWIKIPLLFKTIKLSYRFSLNINFTAGLEFAFNGVQDAGLRGSGTLAISAMGHRLQFNVRLSSNPDAVTQARERTQKYLNLGLEATEVEATPGLEPAALMARSAEASLFMAMEASGVEASGARGATVPLAVPNYSAFVVRDSQHAVPDSRDTYAYFVLFPRAVRDGGDQTGFLPVPPSAAALPENFRDFSLIFPQELPDQLQWFDPRTGDFFSVTDARYAEETSQEWLTYSRTDQTLSWRANWRDDKAIFAEENAEAYLDNSQTAAPESVKLRDYLIHAYIQDENQDADQLRDPVPLAVKEQEITDERVQNPTDDAFEAAVRGATEQFRSSPFFKRDPNCLYERQLAEAFRPDTTIYADQDPAQPEPLNANQQAHQVRSMVINDLITALRKYVEGANGNERQQLAQHSVAFQMGLVFRVPKAVLNTNRGLAWLNSSSESASESAPRLRQRTQPASQQPDSDQRSVRTFNVLATDFSKYPPQFQQVHHFTDANTIAIAWDLVQTAIPAAERRSLTRLQQEPEHNLMYYEVRRRSLTAQTPEVVYQVKGASVLHRTWEDSPKDSSKNSPKEVLNILRPRFQMVDHFTNESLDDIIGLPVTGLSYLYTITPYDFGGSAGHPLTLVATRYPNEPPAVPVDGQFTVCYRIDENDKQAANSQLDLAEFQSNCTVTWSEPTVNGPQVPIDNYYLVFRKQTTLPIGSYGLDSSTQRPRSKLLPTSNSRALPTDIKIPLQLVQFSDPNSDQSNNQGSGRQRLAYVSQEVLRQNGILPRYWQPEAWTLFIQTESVNGVLSALAPVQVLLKFEQRSSSQPESRQPQAAPQLEERQPAELEWLPKPLALALLPPEDQRATVGETHVPMPTGYRFQGSADSLSYQVHPAGLRCIRFRWNQGPSQGQRYPLALTASYDLLELDIDAHTNATFNSPDLLADALRLRQTVQMLAAADLLLTPGDTLATNQWEAWYPSQVERRRLYRENPEARTAGAQIQESTWYSWRESILVWPEWSGLTDASAATSGRATALHPFLEELIQILQDQPDGPEAGPRYRVALQTSPPLQPQTLASFLQSTAETADPYGWGILQRFGLTAAFTVQLANTGEYVTGNDLLNLLAAKFADLRQSYGHVYPHLHVELLFQAANSISLESSGTVPPEGLLALLQVSLRPTIQQQQQYYRVRISGDSKSQIKLRFELRAPLSLIDQTDPGSGQVELAATGQKIERTVTVPLSGEVNLLLRTTQPPVVKQIQKSGEAEVELEVELAPLPIYSPLTAYFTANPEQLAAAFALPESGSLTPAQQNWQRFQRYAESLNSSTSTVAIQVPTEAKALTASLPDLLLWLLRFFKAAAVPTAAPAALAATPDGPWLATAYPRVDTPAPATPDASGRLTYDYLIADKWAHTYRYYIRPSHRYALLWDSLLTSPLLFPNQTEAQRRAIRAQNAVQPDPSQGGLDLVLDRIQPLTPPVILSSARLDPPSSPGQPVPPGRTWEVIIAQHPEQTLIERNQTLARQLQFRQVAFTLLRRFAYSAATGDDWVQRINALEQIKPDRPALKLKLDADGYAPEELPGKPNAPDHLNFQRIPLRDTDLDRLSPEDLLQIQADLRSLDLPKRLGNFQQGALVLQWDTLPFFYQHQLLTIAQSDHQVSEINRVIHKDFEYRSPLPSATAVGHSLSGQTFRALLAAQLPDQPANQPSNQPISLAPADSLPDLAVLQVSIPLNCLWDSLPATVRQQWPSEAPQTGWEESQHWRSPSALPDLEVVYQIIQILEGDLAVQVEALLDQPEGQPENQPENQPEQYKLRQLGKSFLGHFEAIAPPRAKVSADYLLRLSLVQVSLVALLHPYSFPGLGDRWNIQTQQLKWYGVFGSTDRRTLQQVMIPTIAELELLKQAGIATDEELLERWYASGLVRSDVIAPTDQPVSLAKIPGLSYLNLALTLLLLDSSTPLSSPQAVIDLANLCDAKLKVVLLALLNQTETNPAVVRRADFVIGAVPLLTSADFPGDLVSSPTGSPAIQQLDPTKPELTWVGSLSLAQTETLRQLLFDPAVERLRLRLQVAQARFPYGPPSATPPLPQSIFNLNITPDNPDQWTLQWTGELTDEAIRQIHDLLDDPRYRSSAIALFRQVLAGQRGYIEELRRPMQFLVTRRTALSVRLIAIDRQIQIIDQRLADPRTTPEERNRLQAEKAVLIARKSPIEAEQADLEREIAAAQAQINAAESRLNAALVQFEALPSAGPASQIPTMSVARFLAVEYRQTVVWRVTVPLLQERLRASDQPQAADWLDRLTIPSEPGSLTWQNLDGLEVRELQTQVQQALAPDNNSPAVASFLAAFNSLIDAIAALPFICDYRPLQSDLPPSLVNHLIVRGRLLQASRSLNQDEQTRLLQRFSDSAPLDPNGSQDLPTQNSLKRFFKNLQDKAAIDRLYERWLVQCFVPAAVDLTGVTPSLAAKLATRTLPAPDEYALVWQGSLSRDERTIIRRWRAELTDPAQIDAVDQLLRQVPQAADPAPQTGIETGAGTAVEAAVETAPQTVIETAVLARGTAPDLTSSLLDPVRQQLRLGTGTILRYHGLMTLAEAAELRTRLDRNLVQQLFAASLTQSLQGGELRIMSRRGSAKPSDLVPILPHQLS